MRKVVVTGGAGFIGSHLAEAAARHGWQVVIIDDLSTGRKANIEHLLRGGGIQLYKGSITDLPLLQRLFRGAEYVFHQAALPSVPRSIENPQSSHEINATGTLNVLLAARDNRVKKVIYASSSSAYGDTHTLPKREDMPPNPQSPYAVTKLAGEYYCQVFTRLYGLPTACLRYFNVYGPRQDPESQYAAVIPRFIIRVAGGSPPIIFGDGEQTRDFTFVGDVVKANLLAAESESSGVFNIGSGQRISIKELARLIIRLMGGTMQPSYEAARAGDVIHSLADISRAAEFGYKPECGLEEGLKQTIKGVSVEAQSG